MYIRKFAQPERIYEPDLLALCSFLCSSRSSEEIESCTSEISLCVEKSLGEIKPRYPTMLPAVSAVTYEGVCHRVSRRDQRSDILSWCILETSLTMLPFRL